MKHYKKSALVVSAVMLFMLAGTWWLPGQTGERLPGYRSHIHSVGTVPINGTNCVQTGTLGATISGGTFQLNFAGMVSQPITWVGSNYGLLTNIQAALDALPTVGAGNSAVVAGTMTNGANGTFLIKFMGGLGLKVQPVITVQSNNLTGAAHTLTFAITTPGVEADGRISSNGSLAITADTGAIYRNVGIPLSPLWVAYTLGSTPTPTATATSTPSVTSTPTATSTPSSTSTPTATATPTTSP